MTKREFEQKMKEYGIDLGPLGIHSGVKVGFELAMGVYQDNDEWVLYRIGTDWNEHEMLRGTEEDVYDQLFVKTIMRMDYLDEVPEDAKEKIIDELEEVKKRLK